MEKKCGDNQVCVNSGGSTGSIGNCSCQIGFFWNANLKQCLTTVAPTESPTSSSKPSISLIAGLTVAGTIVLVGVFIFIVYKYRRHNERYGQHTLLVDNENDTEMDPDSAMITG